MKRPPFPKTPEAVKVEADALIRALAVINQTWTAEVNKDACWFFHINNKQGHRLQIDMSDASKLNNGKYKVAVCWDGGRSQRYVSPENNQTFGIGFNRGIEVLATEIVRRVLPYVEENWDAVLAEVKAEENQEDQREAEYKRLMAYFGREVKEDHNNHYRVSGVGMVHNIQLNHDGSRATVDIGRHSLPIEKVYKLLDWLKANISDDE